MYSVKKIGLTAALFTAGLPCFAAEQNNGKAEAAWLDGKAETTLLLNSNLNSFDINTDVSGSTVLLTGAVQTSVDKQLAGELVAGLEGVEQVDNRLEVLAEDEQENTIVTALTDTKITSVLSTRLLLNGDVNGADISVDTEQGVVTLSGEVQSSSEKDLVVAMARNTTDVKTVVNNLEISQ